MSSKETRRSETAGRSHVIMAISFGVLIHAGYTISNLRENKSHVVESIPFQIILQVILGGIALLFGTVGSFKPIRVADAPKASYICLNFFFLKPIRVADAPKASYLFDSLKFCLNLKFLF